MSEMKALDLGVVRGSKWYGGNEITGVTTVEQIYPESGIAYAYIDDMYLNGSTGNVYTCTEAGEADTAKWVLFGCIQGKQPELIDGLNSDSATKALTANMGRELLKKIDSAGIYPKIVYPTFGEKTVTLYIELHNEATKLIITDSDKEKYELNVEESENATGKSSHEVSFTLTAEESIQKPLQIYSIESTNAIIYSYRLHDVAGDERENVSLNIWDYIHNIGNAVERGTSFTEGEKIYYTGMLQEMINGLVQPVYAIGHVASIWYSIKDSLSLKDKLGMIDEDIANITTVIDAQMEPLKRRVDWLYNPVYTSKDSAFPTSYKTVGVIESGESIASLLAKYSEGMANIRYLNSKNIAYEEKIDEAIRSVNALDEKYKGVTDGLMSGLQDANSRIGTNATNIKGNTGSITTLKNKMVTCEKNITSLDNRMGAAESNINECFTLVSNGKRKLATLLTSKGEPTREDASFDTICNNINILIEKLKQYYEDIIARLRSPKRLKVHIYYENYDEYTEEKGLFLVTLWWCDVYYRNNLLIHHRFWDEDSTGWRGVVHGNVYDNDVE